MVSLPLQFSGAAGLWLTLGELLSYGLGNSGRNLGRVRRPHFKKSLAVTSQREDWGGRQKKGSLLRVT